MIDQNGSATSLQPGDILVFDIIEQDLQIVRFGFRKSQQISWSILRMNDEEVKLYLMFNHRDKITEFLIILGQLFNLDFKECSLNILPKKIMGVEDFDEDFIFAFEALSL